MGSDIEWRVGLWHGELPHCRPTRIRGEASKLVAQDKGIFKPNVQLRAQAYAIS